MDKTKKIKEFCEMTKPEKKEFLTMDLADRLIRVEQKVSAHFNKHISYKDTDYYKHLNASNKKRYEKFRKYKTIKKVLASLFIISPIILLLALNIDMTANVIENNFGLEDSNTTQFIIWAEAMFFAIIAVYIAIRSRVSENREDMHLSVLDNLHLKRHLSFKSKIKKGF